MPEDYFGEEIATRYDAESGDMFDPEVIEPTVAFLADLAGGGAALELGIGTGRIALPLAQRGVPVHGIDLSEAMVARLRAKPGGEGIPVAIGDFATTKVQRSFPLVYLVFNTIVNLTTQDEQVACFENAAAHLAPGGAFVIEVGVPSLRRLLPGETVVVSHYRRAITASTSSTSRTRASSPITSPPRATGSASGRSPSVTCGPRSSI